MSDKEDNQPAAATQTREQKPGLAYLGQDCRQRLQADLDRAMTDKMMSFLDVGSRLADQIGAGVSLTLPTLDDIDRKLAGAQMSLVDERQIDQILELDKIEDLTVNGVKLNDLLGRGGVSGSEQKIIRLGLQFVRSKRYVEAIDWWTLNRPKDSFAPLYQVLTLLLAWTYQMSGDERASKAAFDEVEKIRAPLK